MKEHCTGYRNFAIPKNLSETEKKKIINEYFAGLPIYNVKFFDKICTNYNDAVDFIEKNSKSGYELLIVKYIKRIDEKDNLAALEKQYCEVSKKWKKRDNFYFADSTSDFVDCKNCGSHFNTIYFNQNVCPICHSDLRPKTELDRIKSLENDLLRLREQIYKEKKRLETLQSLESDVEMWLVRYDYDYDY